LCWRWYKVRIASHAWAVSRPPRIDRADVLAVALDTADEHGLATVTMQAVAGRLAVTPMA